VARTATRQGIPWGLIKHVGFGGKWITAYWFSRYKNNPTPLQEILDDAPAIQNVKARDVARNMSAAPPSTPSSHARGEAGTRVYSSAQNASTLTPACAIKPANVPGLIGRCIGTTTVRLSWRKMTCEPVCRR
jgi:hypothetical protein